MSRGSAPAQRRKSRSGTARAGLAIGFALACWLGGLPGCDSETQRASLLILLTADTLRADRLGSYGGNLGLTPQLDALARESIVFTATYAPTSLTLPSMSAIMTGRYPSELGIWRNESGLPESTPTLAGELRRRGWRTFAVIGNFVLRRESGFDAGFDHYDDSLRAREAVRSIPERVAKDTTDAGLALLDRCAAGGDNRCAIWIHYQDPHGPYTPPEGRRERYLPIERRAADGQRELPVNRRASGFGGIPNYQVLDERRDVAFYRAGYDAEVNYMDEEIGRLLDGLEERDMMNDALIVFAADHGEALGEGGYWFAHGENLSEVLVRVPFFIRVPGRRPARREDVVSLVDLYPTILHELTGESDLPGHRGRDLLAEGAEADMSVPYLDTRGASTVRRYGIVHGKYKWIVSEHGDDSSEILYRLDGGTAEIVSGLPDKERELRERLDQLVRRYTRGALENRQQLSDEDRAMLRALGYAHEAPSAEGDAK